MAESNKKSATMALKEGKREPEGSLETKLNLKKHKKDGIVTLISEKAKNESEDDSKDVGVEITSSSVSSNNRLEVRTKRGKRATYTPQSRISGNDDQTVIVKGFDSSLPEDFIKSTLSKYFRSCGEITSLVVPTNSETGAVMGCAYIELKEGVEKALKLNGNYLGGIWKLVVEKVSLISDFGPPSDSWPYPYRCNGLTLCRTC